MKPAQFHRWIHHLADTCRPATQQDVDILWQREREIAALARTLHGRSTAHRYELANFRWHCDHWFELRLTQIAFMDRWGRWMRTLSPKTKDLSSTTAQPTLTAPDRRLTDADRSLTDG
jgi:hypothetical protein